MDEKQLVDGATALAEKQSRVIKIEPAEQPQNMLLRVAAYVGKQLFEIIETVDMGPYEAMEALGATRLRAFTTAVFPQVLPTYLSVSLFCLEGNVRYASILGYVGAGGLGLIMNEKIGWREYDSLGMILIVLFVTVMVIEGFSHALRKRLT